MADVFVSYKSEDRERARLIATTLEGDGFDVWWDPSLQTGEDYQEVIDRNLREALVVVVLWSPRSVVSRWVRSEATVGDRFGALAPALIAPCELPTAFVLVQTADLTHWTGDRGDPKWREFSSDIAAKRDRRKTAKSTGAAPAPPSMDAIESLFWQSIKDSSEQTDFQSYIRRYPNGHFTDLAETRLRVLGRTTAAAPGPKPPRGVGSWIAALAVVVLAVGAVGWWSLAQMRREDNDTAVAAVETTFDAAARLLVGRYRWAGIACGAGPEVTSEDDALVFSMAATPTIRHAVDSAAPEGVVRTHVVEPEALRGEVYEFRVDGNRTYVTLVAGGAESDEWERCP